MTKKTEKDIGDYALIGDRISAALVSKTGSIDWFCAPRFDSEACFAALIGSAENGRWKLSPKHEVSETSRSYLHDTLILETRLRTSDGEVAIIDFMSAVDSDTSIVRIVKGVSGRVDMAMELSIRPDFGRIVPWIQAGDDGRIEAIAGPHRLMLDSDIQCRRDDGDILAEFTVGAGEEVSFALSHSFSFGDPRPAINARAAFEKTRDDWTGWVDECSYDGRWRDQVVRSLVVLKALTFAPTGGIVAAPTTSLPEQPGGSRNWDYRFCWLRDATFTLVTLMEAGYGKEAGDWRNWLLHAVAGDASQVQPLYTILGESRIEEVEIDWLEGFNGAKPVRVGNAAFSQVQHDKIGEVIDTLHQARKYDSDGVDGSWDLQKALIEHLEKVKDSPGCGIWEMRGPERHFVHSKVMTWVAFDRAVRAIKEDGLDGPLERWTRVRDDLHREICQKGFDEKRQTFRQAYDSDGLDAACLMLPLVGFLPADDPRMIGTVKAIENELMVDGFVRRYDTSASNDGMSGDEGVFLACSFWLVDNYVLQGRMDDAIALFERLVSLVNDVGLLAEEYDITAGRQIGNFPQALSHLSLVGSALNIAQHHSPADQRSKGSETPDKGRN